MDEFFILENQSFLLRFNSLNGSIIGLMDKKTNTEIISEPRLAESFQLLVPLPHKEGNYIIGKDQKLTDRQLSAGRAILTWADPLVSMEGSFDISVEMQIELTEEDALFTLTVNNKSEYSEQPH